MSAISSCLSSQWPPSAVHSTSPFKPCSPASANMNAKDSRGDTPLHAAAPPEVVEVLVAAGADVDVKDGTGRTARGNRSVPPLGGASRSANSGRSGPSCYSASHPPGPNKPTEAVQTRNF